MFGSEAEVTNYDYLDVVKDRRGTGHKFRFCPQKAGIK
jgi:hypothetical protein